MNLSRKQNWNEIKTNIFNYLFNWIKVSTHFSDIGEDFAIGRKFFECDENFGRFSEGKTISELFEQCSKFHPILKAMANQKTERKIASESNLHPQINFQENSRQFEIFPATCNNQAYLYILA